MKIGNVEINGFAALAPMAGVTDQPFRILCREMGASLVSMEMVSANAVCHGNKKTLVAPLWSGNKKRVLNEINKVLQSGEC